MITLYDYTPRFRKYTRITEASVIEAWNLHLNMLDLEDQKRADDAGKLEKAFARVMQSGGIELHAEEKEGRIGMIPVNPGQARASYVLDAATIMMIRLGDRAMKPAIGARDLESADHTGLPTFNFEDRYGMREKVCSSCGKPTKSHQQKDGTYMCHGCWQRAGSP